MKAAKGARSTTASDVLTIAARTFADAAVVGTMSAANTQSGRDYPEYTTYRSGDQEVFTGNDGRRWQYEVEGPLRLALRRENNPVSAKEENRPQLETSKSNSSVQALSHDPGARPSHSKQNVFGDTVPAGTDTKASISVAGGGGVQKKGVGTLQSGESSKKLAKEASTTDRQEHDSMTLNTSKVHEKADNLFLQRNIREIKRRCKSELKRHLTVGGSWECKVCGEKYASKKVLNRHMKMHEGNFCCDRCGIRYNTKRTLIHHMNKSHPEVSAPRFTCKTCKRIYSQKSSLVEHWELEHNTKYWCTLCNIPFTRGYNHTRHMRVFHPEMLSNTAKCFTCNVCGRRFGDISEVKKHQVVHTGKLKCEVCGMSFAFKRSLTSHRWNHDAKDEMQSLESKKDT